VEVEALPSDLPERFVIDISVLNNIGDAIYVKDLQIPQGVEVHTPTEEMIVLITPPAGEEVEETLAEGAAEPEVIEKGKKEEEEEAD